MSNDFRRLTSRNIGTAPITVGGYTPVAGSSTTVIGLSLANVYTDTISVSVVLYDGTNSTHIVKNAPILAGGTLIAAGGDQKIVLQPGDQIRVTSTVSNSVDAILSVLEIS